MTKAIILHTHTCSRGRGGSWCPTVAVLGQHQTWTKSTVGCFDTSLALRKSIEGFTPVSFHPYPVPPPPTPSTGGGPKNSTLLFCIIENPPAHSQQQRESEDDLHFQFAYVLETQMQATHKSLSLSLSLQRWSISGHVFQQLPQQGWHSQLFACRAMYMGSHKIARNRQKENQKIKKKITSSTNSSEVFSDDATISTTTAEEDSSCTRPEQQ